MFVIPIVLGVGQRRSRARSDVRRADETDADLRVCTSMSSIMFAECVRWSDRARVNGFAFSVASSES